MYKLKHNSYRHDGAFMMGPAVLRASLPKSSLKNFIILVLIPTLFFLKLKQNILKS